LDYKKLIESDKLFYEIEHRAFNYDGYMSHKDWASWSNPDVPLDEVRLLFSFIKGWDRFFQGDADQFKEIYTEVFPAIDKVRKEKIEDIILTNEITVEIRRTFDKIANCTGFDRYESTDASKILHTLVPNFFIMWDDRIKEMTVQGGNNGAVYAIKFLPKMQLELREAIETCKKEKGTTREEAIKYICEKCHGRTLAKIVDEYNYMKYTKGYSTL
jgi:hypothetical protein